MSVKPIDLQVNIQTLNHLVYEETNKINQKEHKKQHEKNKVLKDTFEHQQAIHKKGTISDESIQKNPQSNKRDREEKKTQVHLKEEHSSNKLEESNHDKNNEHVIDTYA